MRKNIFVKQANINDCAVCCLASIIKYYGGYYNLEKLRQIMYTSKYGTSAYNIVEGAKKLGFKSEGLRVDDINQLSSISSPFIAHVVLKKTFMHYIVIYNINYKKHTIKIMDPSIGLINISFDKFKKIWTNIIITLIPIDKIISLNKNNTFLKIVNNIIFAYKNIIIVCIIIYFIIYILTIIISLQLKTIIDNININNNRNYYIIIIIIFLSILFRSIFNLVKNDLIIYLNSKMEFSISTNTFSHIIKLPYNYFKTKMTGDIISRINDMNTIKDSIINFIIIIITNSIITLFSFIILYNISKYLFKILLMLLPIIIVVSFIFIPIIKKLIDKMQNSNARQSSYLLECINSFESIKAMNNHNKIIYNYENKCIDFLNNKFKLQKYLNNNNVLNEIVYSLSMFIILFLGYKQIIQNNLTIGNLILFSTIYNYFINSIKELLSIIPNIEYFNKAILRVNDIFEIDSEKYYENKQSDMKIQGTIKFINVSYEINNMYMIFENINLTIDVGKKLAIIGNTGSGKSTFLKLLLRYYEVSRGQILIDNKNILDYNIFDLRKNICYIAQNETLFTDSIYNNIVLDRNINYDYFLKICKICEVDKIINNKTLRYDHLLEENGFNISGGERARIILARALLSDTSIYIFDEALKELDSASEKRILNNIFVEFNTKTFLVVTHKMDNILLFDNILYVNNKNINYVTDL